MFKIDQALRGIVGSTFIMYGIYRMTVTYKQIKQAFFTKENEEE